MPELPEVQTVVNDLTALGLVGRRVVKPCVFWPKTIAVPRVKQFISRLSNKSIGAIRRRGKFIIIELSGKEYLCIHLRMTGGLHLATLGEAPDAHDRVIFLLDAHQQLCFHDTRKFGRMFLVKDLQAVVGRLGPEPLEKEFTLGIFRERIRAAKRMLKPLLLDQRFLAGLGNIYVDESLWLAGLHPRCESRRLADVQIRVLYRAIQQVLRTGIKNLGTTLGTGQTNFYSVAHRRGRNREQLKVFRRTGQPCPRCKTIIQRIIVGQRSTHLCPKCQVAS